jgi:hypothetical protein
MTERPRAIHVTGAAGSGKTTLAAALVRQFGGVHFDADDFEWEVTDPPFITRRSPADRERLFRSAIADVPTWVLSGQLTGWGDALSSLFDLVVFLYVPSDLRLARLERREREAYGPGIEPGGPQHGSFVEFMRLARGYDTGEAPLNTLTNARQWLSRLSCPVIEITGAPPVEDSLALVMDALLTSR